MLSAAERIVNENREVPLELVTWSPGVTTQMPVQRDSKDGSTFPTSVRNTGQWGQERPVKFCYESC